MYPDDYCSWTGKVFGCVGREFELHIPWCKIVKIGPDIILVDIEEKEVRKKIQ